MKILLLCLFLMCFIVNESYSQTKSILSPYDNVTINFYIDTYFAFDLDDWDSPNDRYLAGNCIFDDEFRINVAYLKMNYTTNDMRVNFAFQLGDIPFLLTPVDKQYIKYLKHANFGYQIAEDLWLDLGYMPNPIGVEGSEPINNFLSTVSLGGYFEPGNMLGLSLGYKVSERINARLMYYNSFNIVSSNNINKSLGFSIDYAPTKNLHFYYNGAFCNESMWDSSAKYQLYNNFIGTYTLGNFDFQGQFDFASQTHSNACGCGTAYVTSGMLNLRYNFNEKYAVASRLEFFDDPDGVLSGSVFKDFDYVKASAAAFGFIFKPIPNAYFKAEYQYMKSDQKVFYGNRNYRNSVAFTSGVQI